eukprot:7731406-Alexandrium_andersonii.AAC.1
MSASLVGSEMCIRDSRVELRVVPNHPAEDAALALHNEDGRRHRRWPLMGLPAPQLAVHELLLDVICERPPEPR